MQKKLHTWLQYMVPQHGLTRLVGALMESRQPWLKNMLIDWFIQKYKVDMSIAAIPDPHAYADFNSFFTRHLKEGVRPIATNPRAIISPVDGCISQFGTIRQDKLIQAKGHDFSLQDLLGGSHERAQPFIDGEFITLYLAPKDYHRVHMPFTGRLTEMIYLPGKLFSVNIATSQQVPELFSRNERLVCLFDTDIGPMAVVFVAAMLVAGMATSWAGVIAPPHTDAIKHWDYSQQKIELNRGDEAGYFKLGSTIILLFAPGKMHWKQELIAEQSVIMGQELGNISS